MVKPLSFKGDKKAKKRKHKEIPTSALDSSSLAPQDDEQANEESWTVADSPSDLSGPVMILLPDTRPSPDDDSTSARPTCLASDSAGTVFPSLVENIIPDTAARLSAEPSDVRQVFVVNKVPGEDSGWTIKSHQGRYLSADRVGVVSCEREAAGMEEVFWFVNASKHDSGAKDEDDVASAPILDGAFYLRTSRKTYLSLSASTSRNSKQAVVRADSEKPGDNCILFIRMQSRYKPQLKANRELKAKEKVSRKQLEEAVGRRLDEDEVRKLKKARREGGWHEAVLDARVKSSHDKFA